MSMFRDLMLSRGSGSRIELSPEELAFAKEGGTEEIRVRSNDEWKLTFNDIE